MDYILSGDHKEVLKVIKENRIRVDRGLITFTPYQPEAAICDDKEVDPISDTKEPPGVVDEKKPKRTKKSE